MKRFYKSGSRWTRLETRSFSTACTGKTSRGASCLDLCRRVTGAETFAEEWRTQGEEIDPQSMPLTKLANTAIDGVAPRRDEVIAEILTFAKHDHLCYRTDKPG